MGERRTFLSSSAAIPLRLVFIMWMIFLIQEIYGISLAAFGIFPRAPLGLIGILTGPWVHGNWLHLVSNTFPLLFLGTTLFVFYTRIATRVFFQCYIYTGILVWIFARPTFHIGASGVVYGIAFFLIFFGIFRKDFKSLFISIVIVFFYGSLFYGVLPNQPGVSWESHLLGGLIGTFSSVYYSKYQRV